MVSVNVALSCSGTPCSTKLELHDMAFCNFSGPAPTCFEMKHMCKMMNVRAFLVLHGKGCNVEEGLLALVLCSTIIYPYNVLSDRWQVFLLLLIVIEADHVIQTCIMKNVIIFLALRHCVTPKMPGITVTNNNLIFFSPV